jgi:hypothetical protein
MLLFYIFLYLCVCVFPASILKDQKHSMMITFEDYNNTGSGNPSYFQKKKSNIYRLCLTLQFETPLLLTQWPFASGLNVRNALQEILLAVIQLKHRKLDKNVWDCSTHSANGNNHQWSEFLSVQFRRNTTWKFTPLFELMR